MKILLFGKNGQLGSELNILLPRLGTAVSLDYESLDLCDTGALRQTLQEYKPNLIVNASAYTAVDQAENAQEKAMKINAVAPGLMAEWARKAGSVLIHYSTDYVFDGKKGSPYTESDPVNPLNVYGLSKLEGEKNIEQAGGAYLIFRTSWVYSVGGGGFVSKVLEWARKNQTLRIVNDQISNPTWARDLAEATFSVLLSHWDNLRDVMKERRGIYHLAGSGYASRFEWTKEILANDPKPTEQLVRTLEPALSDEFPLPAARPLFSALDCSKVENLFGIRLPDWRLSLKKAMLG
jgi:dTDP-4-dehydrorhamnose reductase